MTERTKTIPYRKLQYPTGKKASEKNSYIKKHKQDITGQGQKRHKNQYCRFCDAPNWNPNQKCPDSDLNCHKSRKKGHFAKARIFEQQKRQEIKELTQTVETEESDAGRSINIITEIKHPTDRRKDITMTIRNDGTERFYRQHRIAGHKNTTGQKIVKGNKIIPVRRNYREVDKNEVLITGKITVEAENKGTRKNLSILITEREEIQALLGLDWQRQFNLTIRHIEKSTTQTDQSEGDEIFTQFEKLFKSNQTIKETEIKIQLKLGHLPMKQKARPIQYLLQNDSEKERNEIIKSRH